MFSSSCSFPLSTSSPWRPASLGLCLCLCFPLWFSLLFRLCLRLCLCFCCSLSGLLLHIVSVTGRRLRSLKPRSWLHWLLTLSCLLIGVGRFLGPRLPLGFGLGNCLRHRVHHPQVHLLLLFFCVGFFFHFTILLDLVGLRILIGHFLLLLGAFLLLFQLQLVTTCEYCRRLEGPNLGWDEMHMVLDKTNVKQVHVFSSCGPAWLYAQIDCINLKSYLSNVTSSHLFFSKTICNLAHCWDKRTNRTWTSRPGWFSWFKGSPLSSSLVMGIAKENAAAAATAICDSSTIGWVSALSSAGAAGSGLKPARSGFDPCKCGKRKQRAHPRLVTNTPVQKWWRTMWRTQF